jgi:uncharacterized membrane protein
MRKLVIAYVAALIVMLALDFVWLSTVGPTLYRETLGDILAPDVNYPPAIAFYILYVVGIVYFAVRPALREGNLGKAILNGALFGFFAYATYDLTNQATMRNWTLQITLVDMAWGAFLSAVGASVGYIAVRKR